MPKALATQRSVLKLPQLRLEGSLDIYMCTADTSNVDVHMRCSQYFVLRTSIRNIVIECAQEVV